MKIAYITAGAAGMYCGSCLRDNTLARALMARGHDVVLVPTYTPTRTDEPNVSYPRVFLGGINVYLQHKSAVFRHTPWFADRLFDSPRLLDWVSRFAVKTDAAELGELTVSMLRGEEGPEHKEFVKLATWLSEEIRPDIVDISNGLLLGIAAPLKRLLDVPVLCTLSGEDLFLEGLPEPWHTEAIELLRRRVADVDAFITFSRYYGDFMVEYLSVPPAKLYRVPLGINLEGHGEGFRGQRSEVRDQREVDRGAGEQGGRGDVVESRNLPWSPAPPLPCSPAPLLPCSPAGGLVIGFLARICPEKGLHVLCEAFRILREQEKYVRCRLRIAGYLGARDRAYWSELERKMAEWGLGDSVEYVGELDRTGKIRFLQSLDVFSVPTVYRESKGLPVLEALANRVPVVLPWHGIFTELINATHGGILVPPNDPQALADSLSRLLDNPALRAELGECGRVEVERSFNADRMAEATLAVYEQFQ